MSEPTVDGGPDLVLTPRITELEEELERLRGEYRYAVAIIRQVRQYGRKFARSGNPARKDAGDVLLQFLAINQVRSEDNDV